MLKIKQESSGYPDWCIDDESKAKYVQDFFDKEGIRLNILNILLNPGLRAIAKLLLNSLYGRFAMSVERKQTVIINEPSKFYELLCDPNVIIESVITVGQQCLVVNYETPLELLNQNNTVNICVAAMITCNARLHLYSYIKRMPKTISYYDTDSILSIRNIAKNPVPLPLGSNLGDLTSEIEPGCSINSFVTAGAKVYSIKYDGPDGKHKKTVTKCRGITQNSSNHHIVNFDKLVDLVLHNGEPEYVTNERQIFRTKDFCILSRPMNKIFRSVHNKRRIIPGSYITLPYGYDSDSSENEDQ